VGFVFFRWPAVRPGIRRVVCRGCEGEGHSHNRFCVATPPLAPTPLAPRPSCGWAVGCGLGLGLVYWLTAYCLLAC
jgi:hypothetical protein